MLTICLIDFFTCKGECIRNVGASNPNSSVGRERLNIPSPSIGVERHRFDVNHEQSNDHNYDDDDDHRHRHHSNRNHIIHQPSRHRHRRFIDNQPNHISVQHKHGRRLAHSQREHIDGIGRRRQQYDEFNS